MEIIPDPLHALLLVLPFAFTAFVGLNLFQSAFTKTCPMMWILKRAGLKP